MLSLSQIYQSPRQLLIEVNRIISENLDTPQLHHDDLRRDRSRRGHDDVRARRAHAADLPVGGERGGRRRRCSHRAAWSSGFASPAPPRSSPSCWRRSSIDLHRGDVLVFYTDGITEAMNAESDLFGDARLGRLVDGARPPRLRRAARAHPPRDRGVRRQRRSARRHDDDPDQGRAGVHVGGASRRMRRRPFLWMAAILTMHTGGSMVGAAGRGCVADLSSSTRASTPSIRRCHRHRPWRCAGTASGGRQQRRRQGDG